MKRNSGFSSILTLSHQYQAINNLYKYSNLASAFTEPIPNLSNIKEISSFMRKVNTTFNQLSESERASTFVNNISSVSKANFESLATGIKVQGNIVTLSSSAKATLDSLNSELYKSKVHFKKTTKKTKSVSTAPISPDSSKPLKANVTSPKRSFTISEFNKRYLPAIQYFFLNVGLPISLEIMTICFPLFQENNIQYQQKQFEIAQQQLETEQQQLAVNQQRLETEQQQLAVNQQRLETEQQQLETILKIEKLLEEYIKQSSLNHDTNIMESLYSSISEESDTVSSTESSIPEESDTLPGTESSIPEESDTLLGTESSIPEESDTLPSTESSIPEESDTPRHTVVLPNNSNNNSSAD